MDNIDQANAAPSEAVIEPWTRSLAAGAHELRSLLAKTRNRNTNGISDAALEIYYKSARSYLYHLEFNVVVGLSFKEELHLDGILALFSGEQYAAVPADIKVSAATLLLIFERQAWGDTNVSDDQAAGVDSGEGSGARGSAIFRPPPPNHPIYGRQGIMHGVLRSQAGKATYQLNPALLGEKRNAKVTGHNNLSPGDWFPLQRVALFWGAHGRSQAGIHGDQGSGAYSVVISSRSLYSDLDTDQGEIIHYSADGSTSNRDPTRITMISPATRALQTSLQTRRPVRVLRATGDSKPGRFGPSVGIRYDGLYIVAAQNEKTNPEGGLYLQFTLRRCPGQRSLENIANNVPSRQQIADYHKIKDGY